MKEFSVLRSVYILRYATYILSCISQFLIYKCIFSILQKYMLKEMGVSTKIIIITVNLKELRLTGEVSNVGKLFNINITKLQYN